MVDDHCSCEQYVFFGVYPIIRRPTRSTINPSSIMVPWYLARQAELGDKGRRADQAEAEKGI